MESAQKGPALLCGHCHLMHASNSNSQHLDSLSHQHSRMLRMELGPAELRLFHSARE